MPKVTRLAYDVRHKQPALEQHGIAAEFFAGYTHTAFEPHTLNVLLLSFIVRGRGHHVIGEDAFEQGAGEIGITHYDQPHDIRTDAKGLDIFNIYLDPAAYALPQLPGELGDVQHVLFPPHRELGHDLNRGLMIRLPDPAYVQQLVERMIHEAANPDAASDAVMLHLKTLFLIACCRAAIASGITPLLSPRAGVPGWVTELTRHIDRDFREKLTLEDFADQAGISKGYLCRAFKKHTGKTVFDYLIDRRIQAAMQQLRSTNDKVLAVALDSGFGDLTYFNRAFRTRVGVSPTAYRKDAM